VYAKEIIQIFASESYSRSQEVVFILSVSNLLLGTSALVVLAIHIIKKTWLVTAIWLISAVFNVMLNVYLIPKMGNYGAALASLLSVLTILVLYFSTTQKYFTLKINYFAYVKVLLLLILSFLLCNQINLSFYPDILLKACVILIYIFITYTRLNVIDDFYKVRIRSFFVGIRVKFGF
jgi:O-antigen/teichoic acid export membrane protein